MSLERPVTTAAMAVLLVVAAFPFVALFPDPPAFGPESLVMAAVLAIIATLATAWRAERAGRARILRRACVPFVVTAATTLTGVALHGDIPVPILDLLPGLFGLDGEAAQDAILFEVWCELWLVWAAVVAVLAQCLIRRPFRRHQAPGTCRCSASLGTPPRCCSRPWDGARWLAPSSKATGRRRSWPGPTAPPARSPTTTPTR